MTGEYQHNLDAKGRLFIPARLREDLGNVFYVTLSMDKCLSVYSSESWQNFSDKVNAMPYVKQRKMRPLFAHAAKCELDAQGRILLPQALPVRRQPRYRQSREVFPPAAVCRRSRQGKAEGSG